MSNWLFDATLTNKKQFFNKEKIPGISFTMSFSEKVENRSLGLVSGLYGTLKWADVPLPSKHHTEFLVLEYELDFSKKDFKFARDKVNCH